MGQWRVVEEVALSDCALEVEGRDHLLEGQADVLGKMAPAILEGQLVEARDPGIPGGLGHFGAK